MKKIISLAAAAVMMLTLAACTAKDDVQPTATPTPTASETVTPTNTPEVKAPDITGVWVDTDSRRCVLTASEASDGAYSIDVSWGSDARNTQHWTMTATFDTDAGAFVYTDGLSENQYTENDASITSTVEYKNGTGKIYVENDSLYWDDDMNSVRNGFAFEKSE